MTTVSGPGPTGNSDYTYYDRGTTSTGLTHEGDEVLFDEREPNDTETDFNIDYEKFNADLTEAKPTTTQPENTGETVTQDEQIDNPQTEPQKPTNERTLTVEEAEKELAKAEKSYKKTEKKVKLLNKALKYFQSGKGLPGLRKKAIKIINKALEKTNTKLQEKETKLNEAKTKLEEAKNPTQTENTENNPYTPNKPVNEETNNSEGTENTTTETQEPDTQTPEETTEIIRTPEEQVLIDDLYQDVFTNTKETISHLAPNLSDAEIEEIIQDTLDDNPFSIITNEDEYVNWVQEEAPEEIVENIKIFNEKKEQTDPELIEDE